MNLLMITLFAIILILDFHVIGREWGGGIAWFYVKRYDWDKLIIAGYGQPAPTQQYHGQTTVVVAQPTMAVVQQFRETPVHTKCPHCQAEIVTATSYETGTFAWIICLVLCFVG